MSTSKRKKEVLSDFQGTDSLELIISSAQARSELFSHTKWLQASNLKTIANHGQKTQQFSTQITKIAQQPPVSIKSSDQKISTKTISPADIRTKITVPFLLKSGQTAAEIKSQQEKKFSKKLKKTQSTGSLNIGSLNTGSLNDGSLNTGSLNNGSLNTGSLKNGTIKENLTEEFRHKSDIYQNSYTILNQKNTTSYLNSDYEQNSVDHQTKANKIMEYSLVEEFEELNKKKKFRNQQDTDELITIFPHTSQLCDVTDKTQATTINLTKHYDFINEVEHKETDFENIKHQDNTNINNCINNNMDNKNLILDDFLLNLFENDNYQTLTFDKNNKAQTIQKTSELLDNSTAMYNNEDYLFPDEESFVITEEGISTQDYDLYLQGGVDDMFSIDHSYCTTEQIEDISPDYSKFSMADSSPSLITTKENPMLSEVSLFRCGSPMLTEDDCIPIQYLHNNNNNTNNKSITNSSNKSIEKIDFKVEMSPIIDLNQTDDEKYQDISRTTIKRKLSSNTEDTVIENKKLKRNDNLQINMNTLNLTNSEDSISTPDLCDFVLDLENQHRQQNSLYVKEDKRDYNEPNEVHSNISSSPSLNESAENDDETLNDDDDDDKRSRRTSNTDIFSSSPPSVVKVENPPSVQSNYSDDYWATTSISSSTAPPTPLTITKQSSILNVSNKTKKRRGRPPKIHSSLPDPEEMRRLSEPERRYREQRYKNNEASRQSRQNRKRKEEEAKEEETILKIKNQQLETEYKALQHLESKLKKALSRRIGIK